MGSKNGLGIKKLNVRDQRANLANKPTSQRANLANFTNEPTSPTLLTSPQGLLTPTQA
jgi:hypothetical protein